MSKPKVLILRAPGTNCDLETGHAFELAGAEVSRIHIQQLVERPMWASKFQILCIPGGFSYGDDIAAGRILATELQTSLSDTLAEFVEQDRLVLGICNGFQVMMRLGIFFDTPPEQPSATLTWNHQGRFEDRWVHLKVCNDSNPFLMGIDSMYLPIAHAEGRFVMRDAATADALESAGQLVLRYTDQSGQIAAEPLPFPTNPNGAERNVAGLSDESGRIFGLMPHPERHLFATHHPFWTRRESQPEHGDGFKIFQNAVAFFN